jgi:hypothetical protein
MPINLLSYLINYFIKTPTPLTRSCRCRAENVNNDIIDDSCDISDINKTRRSAAEFQHSQYSFS